MNQPNLIGVWVPRIARLLSGKKEEAYDLVIISQEDFESIKKQEQCDKEKDKKKIQARMKNPYLLYER